MRPDRMMWGAGLALAGAVLAGLVLDLATGLTRLSWAVALAVAVAACAGGVLVLRRRGAGQAASAPVTDVSADTDASADADADASKDANASADADVSADTDGRADAVKPASVRRSGFRFSPVTGGFLTLAAVLTGGAVWLANASSGWQHEAGFAQLWLTPATTATSTLGVRDNYPGQQMFQLVLRDGGKAIGTWDLLLSDGQAWQQTVARPAGRTLTATLDVPGQTLRVTS
jgi:hypothetical protein